MVADITTNHIVKNYLSALLNGTVCASGCFCGYKHGGVCIAKLNTVLTDAQCLAYDYFLKTELHMA